MNAIAIFLECTGLIFQEKPLTFTTINLTDDNLNLTYEDKIIKALTVNKILIANSFE